jgi:hypothetical protein
MWHHVTNHLITSNDKDSNSENRIKLRVRDNLMASVNELKKKNRIFGKPPVDDELTDPVQECDVSEDSPFAFPGGDKEIVEQVLLEGRVQCGEAIKVEDSDGDNDESEDEDAHITRCDTIALVAQLEQLTIKFGDIKGDAVKLSQNLHQFCGKLLHEDLKNSKQTQIYSYFPHMT